MHDVEAVRVLVGLVPDGVVLVVSVLGVFAAAVVVWVAGAVGGVVAGAEAVVVVVVVVVPKAMVPEGVGQGAIPMGTQTGLGA